MATETLTSPLLAYRDLAPIFMIRAVVKTWKTSWKAEMQLSTVRLYVPGSQITVSGFFRCMFEHPGFRAIDDAHVFEIHPVRAVSFGGSIRSFNADAEFSEQLNRE